ncbi:MAG: hypothetical protein ACXVAX_06150 [Pseudobdellovibrio sp.]
MANLYDIVPPFYQNILQNKILNLNIDETKATCNNCLRSRDKRFAYTYKANLKCCTFHPYTPNYAVGALLSDKNKTSGIQKIEAKIANREFALPIGLTAPFQYQFTFLNKDEEEFGNNENLLCPYYNKEQNQCSVWMYRGVVCTTFFCRSDYGQDGQKFWAVMSDYLSYVEMALAEECLVQLDFSPRDLSDQLYYLNKREFEQEETEQTQLDVKTDKALWNGYPDKVEFYKKCFELVKNLDRTQFKEILGNQGLELEKEVLDYGHRRKN